MVNGVRVHLMAWECILMSHGEVVWPDVVAIVIDLPEWVARRVVDCNISPFVRWNGRCEDWVVLDDTVLPQNVFNDALTIRLDIVLAKRIHIHHSVLKPCILNLPYVLVSHDNVPLLVTELELVPDAFNISSDHDTFILFSASNNKVTDWGHWHSHYLFYYLIVCLSVESQVLNQLALKLVLWVQIPH